ncbi:MAG: oligosaccharide flippase family protein [Planctomycetota bacterium]|nr:oligosaccharide flippase family protein [Planctomycetota bacterium]
MTSPPDQPHTPPPDAPQSPDAESITGEVESSSVPPSSQGESLRGKVIRGSVWVLGGIGGNQFIRLASNIVLARLLFPEAFGLMVIFNVFIMGLEMFSDIGIGPSIIQNKNGLEPRFLNTAWTIQIMRGWALWIVSCLLTWPVAKYCEEPLLMYMIPVATLTTVIRGYCSTSLFTLNRRLEFSALTKLELVMRVSGSVVMIAWALISATVWALVAGALFSALIKTVISHWQLRENRDRFAWDQESARELIRFGKWIFLSTIVTFIAMNFDRILLARMLSTSELGIYGIALIFTTLAGQTISKLNNMVIFPVLAKKQDDTVMMVDTFLRARKIVLVVATGMCGSILIGAPLFFEVLYDTRYHDAGPLAQWLVIYTWTSILAAGLGRVLLAQGNSRVLFVMNVVRSSGLVLAIMGNSMWGLHGFIIGMSLGVLLSVIYVIWMFPSKRWLAFRQSINFSLILGVFALVGLGGLNAIEPHVAKFIYIAMTVLIALIPIALAVMVSFKSIFRRGDNPSDESTTS